MQMLDEAMELPVEPGDVIAGKYRVLRFLAAGGMGAVLAATHEVLDQRVAIKLLRPELVESEEALERFFREARATARIRSDYVARVIDVDRLEDGSPFIVMEFLRGRSLDVVVEDDGELDVDVAVDYVMEALTGLGAAHDAGVVHRDLKPSNLFVTKVGDGRLRVKLLDFGISKVLNPDPLALSGALTGMRQLLGSPQYMSPEQITSPRNVDARSDIWSMGVILYEVLAGKPAFDGETVGEVLSKILSETPPRLDTIRPDVEPDLADIIARAMNRLREDRFESAYEMLRALSSHGSSTARHSLRFSTFPPPSPEASAPELPILETPISDRPTEPPSEPASVPERGVASRPASAGPLDETLMAASGPTQNTRRTRFAAVAFALGAVASSWFALHDDAPAASTRAAASLRAPLDQDHLAAPLTATAPAPAPTPTATAKKTAEVKAPPPIVVKQPPVEPVKTAPPPPPPFDPEDLLEDRD